MLTGPMTNRRSDAKNAYDLMSDIRDYILEEPKRIYMGDWMIVGHERIKSQLDAQGPVCGTVGCIAGNAAVLTNTPWSTVDRLLSGGNSRLQSALLGMFYDTEVNAKYGTKKYAQIVAKRIQEFQRGHEADLRVVSIEQH